MVHCDPAPPHPPEDVVINAICLDWELALAMIGLTVVVVAVMRSLSTGADGRDGSHERGQLTLGAGRPLTMLFGVILLAGLAILRKQLLGAPIFGWALLNAQLLGWGLLILTFVLSFWFAISWGPGKF